MPLVEITIYPGRTDEEKSDIAKKLTDAVIASMGVPTHTVDVIIHEVSKSNWATGGEIVAQRTGK
jgi:4-oxalocrotonate tautomerase